MTTSASATERAQQAASTAAHESRDLAGTAKEEAQHVASVAAEQARPRRHGDLPAARGEHARVLERGQAARRYRPTGEK